MRGRPSRWASAQILPALIVALGAAATPAAADDPPSSAAARPAALAAVKPASLTGARPVEAAANRVAAPTPAPPICSARARRGVQGEVWVSFGTAVALNGWTLTWHVPDSMRIGAMWVAEFVSHTGGVVTARNLYWNANIPAGGSMTIGYYDGGGFFVPSGFALNGVPCAS